jgi:hypothetical protein
MRKMVILALLAVLGATPVCAADAAKAEGGKKEGDTKKGGKPGTNVDMPFLMAPMINAEGKLFGYAFISSRLTATSEGVVTMVREKLPFIQDVMVRDVNNAAVATPEDPEKVDIGGLEKRLLSDATKILGAGKVKLITVCTVQVSPLHPVQTQARDAPMEQAVPAGTTPKNPLKSRCDS